MNDRVAAPSLGLDDDIAWPEDAVEVARIGEAPGPVLHQPLVFTPC